MYGVAVVIIKENKVLMGKRLSQRNYGVWAVPGGKVDEEDGNFTVAAAREVLEETGLNFPTESFGIWRIIKDEFTELKEKWETIYLYTFYQGDSEPITMEPNKCEKWEWISKEELINLNPVWNGTKEVILEMFNKNF